MRPADNEEMSSSSAESVSIARMLAALLCGGAVVAILLILTASGSSDVHAGSRAVGIAVILAFFCLTAAAGWRHARRGPELGSYLLGYVTVALSLIAFGEAVSAYWSADFLGGGNWRSAGELAIVALAAANVSLLLGSERFEDSDEIRLVRLGAVAAVVLLTILALVEISRPGPDVSMRLMGIVAVLYILGAVLVPLLQWAERDELQQAGDEQL